MPWEKMDFARGRIAAARDKEVNNHAGSPPTSVNIPAVGASVVPQAARIDL